MVDALHRLRTSTPQRPRLVVKSLLTFHGENVILIYHRTGAHIEQGKSSLFLASVQAFPVQLNTIIRRNPDAHFTELDVCERIPHFPRKKRLATPFEHREYLGKKLSIAARGVVDRSEVAKLQKTDAIAPCCMYTFLSVGSCWRPLFRSRRQN